MLQPTSLMNRINYIFAECLGTIIYTTFINSNVFLLLSAKLQKYLFLNVKKCLANTVFFYYN